MSSRSAVSRQAPQFSRCSLRLPVSTTPYPSNSILHPTNDKFRSVTFINTIQSFFSILSSLCFLSLTRSSSASSWRSMFGLPSTTAPPARSTGALLRRYATIASVATMAAPFGFLSLSHISFPTLLLGKSCKLVPVMLMNIVLYRRKFPLHKYLLVGLVTVGIWLFMLHKPTSGAQGGKGGRESSSVLGLTLLGINLVMDGITNSSQDELFKSFTTPPVSGPQMMFFMNTFSCLFNLAALIVPFAAYPRVLVPAHATASYWNELSHSISFVSTHPSILRDIVLFGLTGSIGQLFIFVTLSLYGSLTLVTITVTRKMCTMLLSVVVFEHELTRGQWAGVACVFVAVGMEAVVGIREKQRKKNKANEATLNGRDKEPASNRAKVGNGKEKDS